MKKELKKLKDWSVKNKSYLTIAGVGVVTTITIILFGKHMTKLAADREKELIEVVVNNLKLKKDGEIVEVIVNHYSDDYTRTNVYKRWTKQAGELLYLGEWTDVKDLSDEQKIGKQFDKIGKSIASAVYQITKS